MSKLIQTIDQKQKLNPRQILEANIMQLNSSILEKRILEEIENNPMLEYEDDESSQEEITEEEQENDFNWEDLISNPEEYGVKSDQKQLDFNFAESESLIDNFMIQLNDVNIKDAHIDIAEYILGNLDDNGYLTVDNFLIKDKFDVSDNDLNSLIDKIKRLDPPGISSSNIQDCLSVQLEVLYPKEIIAKKIIDNYFNDFANHNYSQIISKIKCSNDDFDHAANLISVLNPSPAANFSTTVNENIIPDIVIEKRKEKWIVNSNENYLPNLRLNKNYKQFLNQKNIDKNDRNFIKKKIESANWFLDAVKNRYSTIVRVAYSIIKFQDTYFNFDKRELSPLTLKKIAEDINVDISTVSRCTNGKFVQLPWGCVELKSFFSEGVYMQDGKQVSNTIIKNEIKVITEKEDKKNPLNDEKITKILNDKGYMIARRTVSKYRESLNISKSRLRRKLN